VSVGSPIECHLNATKCDLTIGRRSVAAPSGVGDDAPVRIAFLASLAFLVVGCSRSRGSAELGASCRSDFDCRTGFCAGSPGPLICTPTCGSDRECPEGWSCHGVTRSGVIVCAVGEAVPMPH
jgi:hypothetical protein